MPIPSSLTAFVLALSVTAAACGSDTVLWPSASELRSTGARINGRVLDVSTPATPLVSVVGTNISTRVSGNGHFELTDVPTGVVRLKFSSSGIDARLTLTGVAAGDRINLIVSLNGNQVRIESEDRDHDQDEDDDEDDDDEDENELEGVVSNLSGTCPTLTFTVRGATVRTNSATDFEGPCSRIANGRRVEVEGKRQPDGTTLAKEVEIGD